MDLRPGEHEIYEGHPSWRSTLLFYFLGLIVAVILGAIAYAAESTGAGVLVAGAVFAILLVVGYVRRVFTRYTITNQRLVIRKGIVARHIDQTRIERLQDIQTTQSVFERILGIGSVDFDTAGGERHDDAFRFAGVADPTGIVHKVDEAMHQLQQPQAQPQQPQGRYAQPAQAAPPPPPPPPPPPGDGL